MIPTMIVIAGPPGSGKSTLMPVRSLGFDSFNVDDRCLELHGSYKGIPRRIRMIAGAECEAFVRNHIEQRVSLALETTMRTTIAMTQAESARMNGFTTVLFFFCTDDPAIHVRRIVARSHGGGHAAPESEIRAIYKASVANLPRALQAFDIIECFDTNEHDSPPRHVASVHDGQVTIHNQPTPTWLRLALDSLQIHPRSP